MQPHDIRLGRRLRRWFYLVFGLLFASGAGWLVLHAFAQSEGEFGPQPHPAEQWLLRLHGAAAMAALVIFGILLPLHVQHGWKANRNRVTGAVMLGILVVLVLSGYALYYAGNEHLRSLSILVHDAVGLAFPLILVWHIVRGRRAGLSPSRPGR